MLVKERRISHIDDCVLHIRIVRILDKVPRLKAHELSCVAWTLHHLKEAAPVSIGVSHVTLHLFLQLFKRFFFVLAEDSEEAISLQRLRLLLRKDI